MEIAITISLGILVFWAGLFIFRTYAYLRDAEQVRRAELAGSSREIWKFFLLPGKIGGEMVWFGPAKIRQRMVLILEGGDAYGVQWSSFKWVDTAIVK